MERLERDPGGLGRAALEKRFPTEGLQVGPLEAPPVCVREGRRLAFGLAMGDSDLPGGKRT